MEFLTWSTRPSATGSNTATTVIPPLFGLAIWRPSHELAEPSDQIIERDLQAFHGESLSFLDTSEDETRRFIGVESAQRLRGPLRQDHMDHVRDRTIEFSEIQVSETQSLPSARLRDHHRRLFEDAG